MTSSDQLIARVLCRAHVSAIDLDAPDEARAILHLAQSFADELAAANPRFDRSRFIKDATESPVMTPHQSSAEMVGV